MRQMSESRLSRQRFETARPTQNAGFGSCTLIFGENGWGKSTLADILRSLTANNPAIILGRKTLAGGPDQKAVLQIGSKPRIASQDLSHGQTFNDRPQSRQDAGVGFGSAPKYRHPLGCSFPRDDKLRSDGSRCSSIYRMQSRPYFGMIACSTSSRD